MSTQLQEIITDNAIRSFNQGFNAGRIEEQARTIELLEPLASHQDSCYFSEELICSSDECSAGNFEHVIKLIKGETK